MTGLCDIWASPLTQPVWHLRMSILSDIECLGVEMIPQNFWPMVGDLLISTDQWDWLTCTRGLFVWAWPTKLILLLEHCWKWNYADVFLISLGPQSWFYKENTVKGTIVKTCCSISLSPSKKKQNKMDGGQRRELAKWFPQPNTFRSKLWTCCKHHGGTIHLKTSMRLSAD